MNYSPLPRSYYSVGNGASLLLSLVAAIAAPSVLAASIPMSAAAHVAGQGANADATAAARRAYGELPIAFEPNQGQVDAAVRYFSRGPGYSLYLTRPRPC